MKRTTLYALLLASVYIPPVVYAKIETQLVDLPLGAIDLLNRFKGQTSYLDERFIDPYRIFLELLLGISEVSSLLGKSDSEKELVPNWCPPEFFFKEQAKLSEKTSKSSGLVASRGSSSPPSYRIPKGILKNDDSNGDSVFLYNNRVVAPKDLRSQAFKSTTPKELTNSLSLSLASSKIPSVTKNLKATGKHNDHSLISSVSPTAPFPPRLRI